MMVVSTDPSHCHSLLPTHGGEAPTPAKLPSPFEGTGCSTLAVSLQLEWRFQASFLF